MQVRPLSQRVTESMFQIAAEFEEALQEEMQNHRSTLALLQELKKGSIDLSEVAVSDNGWRRIPPEPDDNVN